MIMIMMKMNIYVHYNDDNENVHCNVHYNDIMKT